MKVRLQELNIEGKGNAEEKEKPRKK